MQQDFHYYGTYCAAVLAGYSHEEALTISYSAQFVDCCTATLLNKLKAPTEAATTQSQVELINEKVNILGLQKITRIWTSFHFLPYDLTVTLPKWRPKRYMDKYRLICKPNGSLVADTVEVAKKGQSLQAVGIAMHVLADTWAHTYFVGTPSNVINNINRYFYELVEVKGEEEAVPIFFRHNPGQPDDLEGRKYTSSVHQESEYSVMNLGHGRAGHLPDYSYIKYKYLPAWADYEEVIKDNPQEYELAFRQMVYAMEYLRGERDHFALSVYDEEKVNPWKERIQHILKKRQLLASEDWKTFGEELSGKTIPDFHLEQYQREYLETGKKEDTFLGKFIQGALAQKKMVSQAIFQSGNLLAGIRRGRKR